MPAPDPIGFWSWAGFIALIVVILGLDLCFFHHSPKAVTTRRSVAWSAGWFLLALVFAWFIGSWRGKEDALEFVTGYFVEYSLSMDNVAAIAVIFVFFNVETRYQYRVLFWGILGALLMRGVMIGLSAALIGTFRWVLYVFGAFLVVSGIRWGFVKQTPLQPGNNALVRLARRFFPVSSHFDGNRFLTWKSGRRALTPLALVLIMIETTDLVFAVDSVPAVFAVTQKPFIVFTSNIFAILGLRSLYFAVASAIRKFRFLKAGLAAVLIFAGAKMLAANWVHLPSGISLLIVAGILTFAVFASWAAKPSETAA